MPGLIAFLLIIWATPRLLAEISVLPGKAVLGNLLQGETISDDLLGTARGSYETAVAFHGGFGRYSTDLGLLQLVAAQRTGIKSEEGKKLLGESIERLSYGLARGPANSFAWARLASALYLRDGVTDNVIEALRLSYQTGLLADKLIPFRTNFSLSLWDQLDDEMKNSVIRELQYFWHISWENQRTLMTIVCEHNKVFVLSQAVRNDRESRSDFDSLYQYYMTPEKCEERRQAQEQNS